MFVSNHDKNDFSPPLITLVLMSKFKPFLLVTLLCSIRILMYKYEYYQYTKLKIRNTSTLKGHNAIFMLGFLCVSSTLNIFEPLLVEITTANKNIKCLASNTTKININF